MDAGTLAAALLDFSVTRRAFAGAALKVTEPVLAVPPTTDTGLTEIEVTVCPKDRTGNTNKRTVSSAACKRFPRRNERTLNIGALPPWVCRRFPPLSVMSPRSDYLPSRKLINRNWDVGPLKMLAGVPGTGLPIVNVFCRGLQTGEFEQKLRTKPLRIRLVEPEEFKESFGCRFARPQFDFGIL